MRKAFIALAQMGAVIVAGIVGATLSQLHHPSQAVSAQEQFSGVTNCITSVPKSWGDFKGGSAYGLAFQDSNGVVRFVLHPSCGSVNSPADPPTPPIDLEIKRR
jgi:hypothetical protein